MQTNSFLPGYQTPASAYGNNLVFEIPGVQWEKLQSPICSKKRIPKSFIMKENTSSMAHDSLLQFLPGIHRKIHL